MIKCPFLCIAFIQPLWPQEWFFCLLLYLLGDLYKLAFKIPLDLLLSSINCISIFCWLFLCPSVKEFPSVPRCGHVRFNFCFYVFPYPPLPPIFTNCWSLVILLYLAFFSRSSLWRMMSSALGATTKPQLKTYYPYKLQ